MSLSEVKMKALELLWKAGRSVKSRELAQQLGLRVPPTNLHLVWLKRKGYVFTPEKGLYAITEKGKEVLVLPKIDRKQALHILSDVPREKAFHFYRGVDQYLGTYANNLSEFCDKIQIVGTESLEFHLPRKDFESWFLGLGDFELAKKMSIIRKSGLLGEDLRKRVYELVKSRCEELQSLARKLGFV
ncbi:MAG: hypothetical protein GWN33_08910 [Gammaproteobacteria bacterium]|nr:hypothetical protein [Gammaproteobacteria bacterium]